MTAAEASKPTRWLIPTLPGSEAVRDLLPPNRALTLLFFLWVAYIFVVQELTLVAPHSQTFFDDVLDRVVRLALDGLVIGGLLALSPRKLVPVWIVTALVLAFSLLSYHAYFERALSWRIMSRNIGEGAGVVDAGLEVIGIGIVPLVIVPVLMLVCLHLAGWRHPSPWRARLKRSGILFGVWLAAIFTLHVTYKNLNKLLTWESVDAMGKVYGYVPTWVAEELLFQDDVLLGRALERAKALGEDRISGVAAPLPPAKNVVFLQIESFDQAMMGFRVKGASVLPALEALAASSRVYRVRAPKVTGSLDSDFMALMGVMPSEDIPTYKIAGYPYGTGFVAKLNARGYTTRALHGVSGTFFNRRPAYVDMGFDTIHFREELERAYLPSTGWSVLDDQVLRFAAELITATENPQFTILITATSHIPFHHLPEEANEFFPGSSQLEENYLDVMHYVDEAVGTFVASLGPDTLVVIYGDHTSKVDIPDLGYTQVKYEDTGVVPFIVHHTSENLAKTQNLGPPLATSGELVLLEMMRWVHGQILDDVGADPTL